MKYIESTCTDPRWNLALEEYVFSKMDRSESYFMLWVNHNTIVVGKNQNAVAEINTEYVREHGITVVRRLSGGGAVYHDAGNLNFTFITDSDQLSQINFERFCRPVVDTLREMGVPAEVNGRNDMTIRGKKFSGNSQYMGRGRVMHHGTLMFKSDLQKVAGALRVSRDKIRSKGISSVSSRVTNISDYLPDTVTMEDFKRALLKHILGSEDVKPYELTPEDLAEIDRLKRERYDRWDWTYGYSPKYQINRRRRIEGVGSVEVSMEVEQGRIRQLQLLGDFFSARELSGLVERLVGCRCRREDVEARLEGCPVDEYIKGLSASQLAELIAET